MAQWLRICPCNAEGVGSIPGWGAKTPYAVEQLSLHIATTMPASATGARALQLEKPPCATARESAQAK